jgi:rare lipoprotein A
MLAAPAFFAAPNRISGVEDRQSYRELGDRVQFSKLAFFVLTLLSSATPGPATAQDFSLSDLFASFAPANTTGWTATVSREDQLPKDPRWTAVVHARRDGRIETGSVAPHSKASGPRITGTPHALDGMASFYSMDQMTASGEVFNKNDMTAAHKTLPLGTKVKVTNLENGRTAVVRINDRGPFIVGRVIDLSEAAADVLDMRTQGVAPVRVDLIGR